MDTSPTVKEILPIGVQASPSGERRIGVLGELLLDEFARAGIEHVFLIVDPAKADKRSRHHQVWGCGGGIVMPAFLAGSNSLVFPVVHASLPR